MLRRRLIVIMAFGVALSGCSSLKRAVERIQAVEHLQFKLNSISDFSLSGVSFSQKTSVSEIRASEMISIGRDFAAHRMPARFVLNVDVRNPNTEQSGFSLVLRELRWRLVIDTTFGVKGTMSGPVRVPEGGAAVVLPVPIEIDLFEIFRGESLRSLINLALALGGKRGSPARLRLYVQPTVDGPFGPIQYPEEIEVIDREFR
ncbi:MAG: hypothetical protein ACP5JH_00895 [Bacteroidota bacterium]